MHKLCISSCTLPARCSYVVIAEVKKVQLNACVLHEKHMFSAFSTLINALHFCFKQPTVRYSIC